MNCVLVNGVRSTSVSALDRGLQYGDGLFETLNIRRGRVRFLDWHYQRLCEGAQRLQLAVPSQALIESECLQIAVGGANAIKLIITRGPAQRGYRMPKEAEPTRIVAAFTAPTWPAEFSQAGVRLRYCQTRLGRNPALAGIKHLNRLEQVLARSEWDDADIAEGLMCDDTGAVICATQANLFLVKGTRIITPELADCGIAGIMRRALMQWATMQGRSVEQRRVMADELLQADEVLLTNTLIGAWPVRELAGRSCAVVGIARQFNAWLESQ